MLVEPRINDDTALGGPRIHRATRLARSFQGRIALWRRGFVQASASERRRTDRGVVGARGPEDGILVRVRADARGGRDGQICLSSNREPARGTAHSQKAVRAALARGPRTRPLSRADGDLTDAICPEKNSESSRGTTSSSVAARRRSPHGDAPLSPRRTRRSSHDPLQEARLRGNDGRPSARFRRRGLPDGFSARLPTRRSAGLSSTAINTPTATSRRESHAWTFWRRSTAVNRDDDSWWRSVFDYVTDPVPDKLSPSPSRPRVGVARTFSGKVSTWPACGGLRPRSLSTDKKMRDGTAARRGRSKSSPCTRASLQSSRIRRSSPSARENTAARDFTMNLVRLAGNETDRNRRRISVREHRRRAAAFSDACRAKAARRPRFPPFEKTTAPVVRNEGGDEGKRSGLRGVLGKKDPPAGGSKDYFERPARPAADAPDLRERFRARVAVRRPSIAPRAPNRDHARRGTDQAG